MSSITNQPIEKGYSSALGPSSVFSPLSLDVPARLSILTPQDLKNTQRELRAKIVTCEELELLAPTASGRIYLQKLKNESAVLDTQIKQRELEEENVALQARTRLFTQEKAPAAVQTAENARPLSTFDELIETMTALKTTLNEASTSSNASELKPMILHLIQKAHELSKRKLEVSQITSFDLKRFINFFSEIRKGISLLSTLDSNAFDYQFYSKNYYPFSGTLFDVAKVLLSSSAISDTIENGTRIGGGTCHGHSLAVHNSVPVGEESVRVASFLQSSYNLSKSFLNTNFQEIGKTILNIPKKVEESAA